MLQAFFTTTLLKWLARRGLELGGLLTVVSQFDPLALQKILGVVGALLSGDFENVSIGAVIGLAGTLGGLIWNGISTFKPHVTVGGVRVDKKELPVSTQVSMETQAKAAVEDRKQKPSVFDRLFKR